MHETQPEPVACERLSGAPYVGSRRQATPEGYVEEEWGVSGRASAYAARAQCGRDGAWSAESTSSAPFTTRVIVRRPADEARANGMVLVEWLNVSSGADVGVDWLFAHRELTRVGATWVGVSAQKVGIDGAGPVPGRHLKKADPDKYGVLIHPGDQYSFDIFSQVAGAVRSGVLGISEAHVVLAAGHSQSASRLVTYINAVDPLVPTFDAFLVHGRPAIAAPLDASPPFASTSGLRDYVREHASRIRADLRVPVLVLQAETDLEILGSRFCDQAASPLLREWQIAGASHSDTYLSAAPHHSDGTSIDELYDLLRPTDQPYGPSVPCAFPINGAPQQHYITQAAIRRIEEWVRTGVAPSESARIVLAQEGFELDDLGIALGGIRTGWVDAPVAIHSGLGQPGESLARLFGTTRALSEKVIRMLYPGGQAEFLERFRTSTERAVAGGFILDEDVEEMYALAKLDWQSTTALTTAIS